MAIVIQSGVMSVAGDLRVQPSGPTSYSSVILADTPVGYWRQEDASAPITDSSGNGYDLVQGATPIYSQPGQVDNSIDYPNTPDRGSISDAASSNAFDLLGNLSLESWVFPVGAQTNGALIMGKNDNSGMVNTHNYSLAFFTGNLVGIQVNQPTPNNNFQVVSVSALPLSTWSHVVGVRDGTSLYIYIDGVLDNTAAMPAGALNDVALDFSLGCNSIGTFGVRGRLDESAVFNYALSPSRILAHYDARNLPGV